MKLVSIGEVLWDVIGPAEHLGGAPLNFAAHCVRLGNECHLVSAVGNDDRGRRALERIRSVGVKTELISTTRDHATGHVTVELTDGQPTFTIHRPAAYDFAAIAREQLSDLTASKPDWIYFGTLAQLSDVIRDTTTRIIDALPSAQRFYDVNLRADSYNRDVVHALLASATVVKLNDLEIEIVAYFSGGTRHDDIEHFCRDLASRFGYRAVCVTRGDKGCALLFGDNYVESPAYTVQVIDTIGAGDAFAAGLVHAISAGWDAARAADFANRLGALVASRAGAIPTWRIEELQALSPSSATPAHTCRRSRW